MLRQNLGFPWHEAAGCEIRARLSRFRRKLQGVVFIEKSDTPCNRPGNQLVSEEKMPIVKQAKSTKSTQ